MGRPLDGDHDLPYGQAGVLEALSARPGRPDKSAEQVEREEAQTEVGRLRATLAEQAVALHLHEGELGWG